MLLAEVTFPASSDQLRLARMLAARIARDMGATDELVEDVRLAVGEACALGLDRSERLALSFHDESRALVVSVRRVGDKFDLPPESDSTRDLARVLVQALAPQLSESDDGLVLTWPTFD